MRKLLRLGKFFLVGAIGMPVHLGVLYGLTEAGLYYVASAAIAVIVAISFNYFLNHYWTFKDRHTSSLGKGYVKYMVVGCISDTVYLGLLYVAVDMLHIYYVLAAGDNHRSRPAQISYYRKVDMENKNFYAKPLENKYDYQNLAEARYTSCYGFKHMFLGLIMPVLGMCMILYSITEVYSGLSVTKVVISLFITMLLLSTFLIMKYRDKAIKSLLKS